MMLRYQNQLDIHLSKKGGWKNHQEDTTDWNNRENAEKWRAAWAAYANRALEPV